MINLLLVLNALLRHGPGLVVNNLAQRLNQDLFRTTVLSLDEPDASLVSGLRARNVRVVEFSRESCPLVALAELMRQDKVNVLHTHGLRADLLGRVAATTFRPALVLSTVHDSPDLYRRTLGPFRGMAALTARMIVFYAQDAIVMVANTVADSYLKAKRVFPFRETFRTIYNGVPDNYLPIPSESNATHRTDALTVATVSRLVPWKGLNYLVEAAAQVTAVSPQVRFLLVGEGESRAELRNQAESRNLQNVLHFAGHRSDIPSILQDVDIFVLPSLDECLPLSLLEAMSAGKPIVATRVGGIPEAIDSEINGLLVPPANADALAQALVRLVTDEHLRLRLGIAARQRYLRDFTIDAMVHKYEMLYQELLQKNRDKLLVL